MESVILKTKIRRICGICKSGTDKKETAVQFNDRGENEESEMEIQDHDCSLQTKKQTVIFSER